MAAAAEQRGLHTMVGLQARNAPSVLYLRQLIQDGYVGRVVAANMMQINGGLFADLEPHRAWRVDRAKGAHNLSISTGHSLDGFLWCIGQLSEVSGIVETLAPEIGVKGEGRVQVTSPDHIIVTGKLAEGGLVTVEVGGVPYHGSGFRIEIYGTEGTIVATAPNQLQATGVKLQGAKKDDAKLADLEVPRALRWVPDEVPAGTPVNLAQMMRRFADGIQKGENPGPTFADAVRNHRLLDAIVESAETGRRVPVRQ
jgi:predicted dehydrogenase